jgi:hypothetical protein
MDDHIQRIAREYDELDTKIHKVLYIFLSSCLFITNKTSFYRSIKRMLKLKPKQQNTLSSKNKSWLNGTKPRLNTCRNTKK